MEKITDRDQADMALRRLGEVRRDLARAKAAGEEAIKRVKDRTKEKETPLKAEEKEITKLLRAWAKKDRKSWDGKSLRTKHGVVGFRKGSTLKLVKTAEAVIARLRAKGLGECVRVKEEPNKELIKQLDKKTIEAVGCQLKPGETFYAEPAEEKA